LVGDSEAEATMEMQRIALDRLAREIERDAVG
jgi:hypothetical protein